MSNMLSKDMSFSAFIDSYVPETPTPPVSPKPAPKRLYHSESVSRALSALSRDLSGLLETHFSSKAEREMPPPFGILPGQLASGRSPAPAVQQPAPSVSGLKRATSFNRKTSEPPENVYSPSSAVLASLEALQPASLDFLDLDVSATVTSANKFAYNLAVQPAHLNTVNPAGTVNPQDTSLNSLINFFSTQNGPTTVDPLLLSVTVSPPSRSSTVPTTPVPALFQEPNHAIDFPPLYNVPAVSSSQSATTTISPVPGIGLVSPTPTTPNLMFDGPLSEPLTETEEENEDEYKPSNTKRAAGTASKLNRRAAASRGKAKATRARAEVATSPEAFSSPAFTSNSHSPPLAAPHLVQLNAHDAEANSDYQCSENGVDALSEQAAFLGGPRREGRRSSTGTGNHPYQKQKPKMAVPAGQLICDYVSPYDGWKCQQKLGRHYDLPRHMEVHAKEEYDLVLTGKLDVVRSKYFSEVTESNVYICLICRKDFSRKDAMQRHIRNASKMSKAKHRSEGKVSIKKRVLGNPTYPHPNVVPPHILQRHRQILERLKVDAQDLGQDVTDWDVENMMPQTSNNVENMYGTPNNAPGIPVGRRTGNRTTKPDDTTSATGVRSTRASARSAGVQYAEDSDNDDIQYSTDQVANSSAPQSLSMELD